MSYYLAIDIGGTKIKYGIIDHQVKDEIIERFEIDTQAQKGGSHILSTVLDITEKAKDKYDIQGVCISTAGMVDSERGEIFYAAPLIPNYIGTNFKKPIEDRFKIKCSVENDVKCAGLSEYVSGAAKGSKVALCLTIGTGIGGCLIINGEIFKGYSSSACEVGYMHLENSDFQTLGSTKTLVETIAKKKGEPVENWDGKKICTLAQEGDQDCIDALEEMTRVLGKGIANICYCVNPQVVVLGGGIMAQEFLIEKVKKYLDEYLVESIAINTTIASAMHKNDAGMLGAYYNFLKTYK